MNFRNYALLCLFAIFTVPLRTLAAGEIHNKLELKPNFSHLLTFDEKIVRYRTTDDTLFKVEILPDIMNSRCEMLIKPLKEVKTNFIVWTENYVYNFDVNARQNEGQTEFFDFSQGKKQAAGKKEASKEFFVGNYNIDLPPYLPKPPVKNTDAGNLRIDLPPAYSPSGGRGNVQ